MPRLFRTLLLLMLLAALAAACSGAPFSLPGLATKTPSQPPTITAVPGPTTAPTIDTSRCAYVWSSRSQPELSRQLNQVFQDAGMREVEAQASAYGEDCLDPDTNSVISYSALQTDFYLVVSVPSINDSQLLGEWIEKIMRVIEQLPLENVPGPAPGQVSITFQDDSSKVSLWFARTRARELIEAGTRGGDLFEALRAQ